MLTYDSTKYPMRENILTIFTITIEIQNKILKNLNKILNSAGLTHVRMLSSSNHLDNEIMKITDSGIFCPACKMKNETGAYICTYCNTPLNGQSSQKTVMLRNLREVTGTLPDSYEAFLDAPIPASERFMDFEIPSKGVVLINLDNGQPVAIQEEKVFILGRISAEIKTKEPLVDLTHFGALEFGISRVHLMIRKTKDSYQIMDLESSNGSWLENQRLVPNQPYTIESGERVRIGRLNLLFFCPKTFIA